MKKKKKTLHFLLSPSLLRRERDEISSSSLYVLFPPVLPASGHAIEHELSLPPEPRLAKT